MKKYLTNNWTLFVALSTLVIISCLYKFLLSQFVFAPVFVSICLVIFSMLSLSVTRLLKNCYSDEMFTSQQWAYFILKNITNFFLLATLKTNFCLPPTLWTFSFLAQIILSIWESSGSYGLSIVSPTQLMKDRIDDLISLRIFGPREESDSEASETNANKGHFAFRERSLTDWSEYALLDKFSQYMHTIDTHSEQASIRLSKLEDFTKQTDCRFILSIRTLAADMEYPSNISQEQKQYISEKMQELDIRYRTEHDESTSRVKRNFSILDELKRRNINISDYEKNLDKKIDKLADLDLKYSTKVFRTQRER